MSENEDRNETADQVRAFLQGVLVPNPAGNRMGQALAEGLLRPLIAMPNDAILAMIDRGAGTLPVEHAAHLLTQDQAAELCSVSPSTMSYWRKKDRGPTFVRLGHRTVRYRRSDVEAWLEDQRKAAG